MGNYMPSITTQQHNKGNIWGFPMLEIEEQPAYWGPAMREDWLNDLNLETPTTLDEWYVVLKAFKEQKGAKYPYLMDASGVGYSIVKAFGVDRNWTQKDGKAIFGPIENEFKQYLTLANNWYNEGLIDPEFVNANQNRSSYMADGVIGAWEDGFWQFTIEENQNPDPNFTIVAVPPPSLVKGEEPKLRTKVFNNRGYYGNISTANKNPAKAVEWFNYLYSEEGTLLLNYSIEGVSYTMENGKPTWTEFMTNNPDGYDINELMNKYCWQNGPFLRDWTSIMFTFSQAAQDANFRIWKGDTSYCLPMISLTADEGTLVANVMSDINTYVSEMIIKFVIGSEPLSGFDTFVKNVKSMGVDSAIEAYQAALDRYAER